MDFWTDLWNSAQSAAANLKQSFCEATGLCSDELTQRAKSPTPPEASTAKHQEELREIVKPEVHELHVGCYIQMHRVDVGCYEHLESIRRVDPERLQKVLKGLTPEQRAEFEKLLQKK